MSARVPASAADQADPGDTGRGPARGQADRTPVPLAVAAGVLVATVVVAGALTPGYDHSVDTVSRLASPGQPHAAVVRVAIVIAGVLVVARAAELRAAGTPCPRAVSRLVGVTGTAMVVAGIAPKDAPGTAASLASRLHVVAAVCGVLALAAAMAYTVRHGRQPIERRGSAAALTLVAVSGAAFPAAWGTDAYGALQRVVLATTLTWLLAVTTGPVTPPAPPAAGRRGRRRAPARPG